MLVPISYVTMLNDVVKKLKYVIFFCLGRRNDDGLRLGYRTTKNVNHNKKRKSKDESKIEPLVQRCFDNPAVGVGLWVFVIV